MKTIRTGNIALMKEIVLTEKLAVAEEIVLIKEFDLIVAQPD
jgi:hypothetical protein